MARRTHDRGVRACERKERLVMIKLGWRPGCRGVTPFALRGEVSRNVRRIGRCHEVSMVAAITGCWSAGKDSILVTRGACLSRMSTGKRNHRLVVIKCRRMPSTHGMAELTILREHGRRMHRILRGRILRLMAGNALRRSRGKRR